MSALDRKVLEQDQPQYQESTAKPRRERDERQYQEDLANYEKEKAEIDKQNAEIEKQNQAEKERYEKELAEFNKQNKPVVERENLLKSYDEKITKLERERQQAISNVKNYRVVRVVKNGEIVENKVFLSRKEFEERKTNLSKTYNRQIENVRKDKLADVRKFDLSTRYPGAIIPPSLRERFLSSLYDPTAPSLVSTYEKYLTNKAIQYRVSRETSIKNAINAPRYTKEQSEAIERGYTDVLTGSTPEGTARAQAIKPTPNVITGKKAEKTRPPAINVNTGQSIMGGQKSSPLITITMNQTFRETPTSPVQVKTTTRIIPEVKASAGVPTKANPRAYVAGLTYQGLDAAGKPIEQKPIGVTQTGKIRVSNLNEWNGQQTDKVRVSDPKIDKMIAFYGYEKTNEIIGNYNRIIDRNNLLIKAENRKNRIEYYKYRRQQVRDDPYFKSPKAQGPPKPQYENVLTAPSMEQIAIGYNQTPEKQFDLIGETKKSFENYMQEINPNSKINQNKYSDRSGIAEPISTLDIALIASPGARIVGGLKIVRKEIPKLLSGFAKQERKPKTAIGEKIYPRNQKQLTPELVNKPLKIKTVKKQNIIPPLGQKQYGYKPAKRANEIDYKDLGEKIGPSTDLTKRPVAAKQSDVRPNIQEKPKPVKFDPSYKPSKRANEIDVSGDTALGEFKTNKIRLGKSPVKVPEPITKERIIQPVKPDPFYKPAKRANEIDLTRDDVLTTFSIKKIRLGKGITVPTKTQVRGKQTKPVEEDYFYKPSKRANEIDVSGDTALGEFKTNKIRLGKPETKQVKRLKKEPPKFKTDKVSFRGTNEYIVGKSGRQQTILIQKAEQTTKKKLLTKRQTPVNINWSEKSETAQIPRTGKAPLQTLIPVYKERKKKPYLTEQYVQMQEFEVPLSKSRPKIKSIERFGSREEFATPQKISYEQPQRIQQSLKFSEPQKTMTQPRYREAARMERVQNYPIQTPKIKTAQKQKLASPLSPKQPVKLSQPTKLKQPQKLVLKYDRPPNQKPPRLIGGFLPPKEEPKREPKKSKGREKADFLGNVPESSLMGVYGRTEITYGQSKINRLLSGDRRVVKGQKRATPRKRGKWEEGGAVDPFGFKRYNKYPKQFRLKL